MTDRSHDVGSAHVELQRPFLKWAGGKTKLVPAIGAVVPLTATRLVEPFVGSGAVALNLGLPTSLLADTNADLIAVYQRLRDAPEAFIAECHDLFSAEANSAAVYYQRREEFNATTDPARRASLFVYLNRHGYNGLCRYNARGGFNVPFGRYAAPYFPRAEMLTFHVLLQRCTLLHADFRAVLAQAGAGDFVYCDPPYVPASATANFTAYARTAFGPQEQSDLAACCHAARQRGAIVALSNHDTPETRALYAGADECHELLVRRQISCHGANRTQARELLVVYRPAA
ncbi:MAG: Dam family site-specific DNA-(adenine-N6)-methyltransferase [Opitutaceae bacterium]|nr:Dam family site-specific DNA-(adenine-N6)-methyltransferase [Opitutaceae bacterium]